MDTWHEYKHGDEVFDLANTKTQEMGTPLYIYLCGKVVMTIVINWFSIIKRCGGLMGILW